MSEYKSADVQRLFDVSSETVRRWAEEFEEYLSPNASPGKGRTRLFTAEDLQVFALVSEYKNVGKTYTDVHVALKMGERGSIEDATQERSLSLQASIELDMMRDRIEQLQLAHNEAIEKAQELENEVIRLKTEVKQLDEVKDELKSAREIINKLNREIGRLEARLEIERENKDDE
jgi:DNA-binding transcriptional MerR regulator